MHAAWSVPSTLYTKEFFSKFLDINDRILAKIMEKSDILSYEDLVIPTAQTYQLRYSVWGSCTYDDYMAQKFDSYDMDWVIDSAEQQRRDGNWDYYNGINLAKALGFEFAYCYNFDMILEDDITIQQTRQAYNSGFKALMNLHQASEGLTLRTVWHAINVNLFLENFPLILNEKELQALLLDFQSFGCFSCYSRPDRLLRQQLLRFC